MNQETSIKMSIQEFNQMLVEDGSDITIVDYIKEINDRFYNIDINFIDDFIELVDKDKCCIPHDMLFKYGVLSSSAGSHNVLKLMEQYKFIEKEHYVSIKINFDRKNPKPEISYLLHPKAFKKILIRSRNTDQFADYYLLLEEAVKHYNDFQILQLKRKLMNICNDRVLQLEDEEKKECFVLVRNNEFKDYPYSVIRGQIKNLQKTLTKLKKTKHDIIINIPCCYANNLYNKIKERLRGNIIYQRKYLNVDDDGDVLDWAYDPNDLDDYNQVSITRHIGLKNITLNMFIKEVELIDEERYEI